MAYQVNGSRVEWNPTAARLRELTEEMPNASVTEFGNVAVKARVDSRSTRSTYLVEDSTNSRGQTITRAEYDRVAAIQDAHIAQSHMVVVDGYIGSDPQFRTRARLIMEAANANVAGMQQQLYYPVDADYDPAAWEPDTTVIYTPNVEAPGYPNDRLIAVDLGSNITRVLNSDYFGESKKGGLRMWNNIVYDRGGLALHAGCKVIPVNGQNKTVLIVGLSGTGKTTTTFTTQRGSKPAQDDFVALMPGGRVYTTENGCFAKTFGLDPAYEPVIYHATTKPDAYLENVSVDEHGKVDFFDTSYTKNGRTTWPFSYVDPGRRTGSSPPGSCSSSIATRTSCPAWPGWTGPRRRPTSCSARPPAPRPAARTRRASSCACRAPTRSSRATWPTWATGCSSCLTARRFRRSC